MKKRIVKRGGKVNPSTPDLKVGVCSGLTLSGAERVNIGRRPRK